MSPIINHIGRQQITPFSRHIMVVSSILFVNKHCIIFSQICFQFNKRILLYVREIDG